MAALRRRDFIRRIGESALGSILAGHAWCGEPRHRKPNIVFILADDLGWAELGCTGSRFNDTPQLDALARQGMRFTDAYAAAPVCSPMRASFMTGQYPARVGITDYLRPNDRKFLSTDHVTVAEALAAAGYACGLIGKWHLMGDYRTRKGDPKLHGFHEVICSESRGIGGGAYFHPYKFMPEVEARRKGEYLTDRLNEEAVDFIARHRGEPFFLFLSHYAVHTRLVGKPDLVAKYQKKPGAGRTRHNPALAAMLESIDQGVGAVLAKLDDLGIADHTAVIFMSDNGGELRVTSNAPLRGGKSQLYEGGIREPLIVRWPGVVRPGSTCSVPVSSIDFYPTIIDMAGARPDPRQVLDGQSLVPLLKQTGRLKRGALFWHYPLARPHFLGGRSSAAVRKGDLKLIEFYDTGNAELYDLGSDVGESTDLSATMPERAAELRKLLDEWRKQVGAEVPQPGVSAAGLQLHLALDEPAGAARARDRSGHRRHLLYHGTRPAPAPKGQARAFNGTDEFLELPRALAPRPAGTPITVAAWVRPEKPDGTILAHGGDRHGYALCIRDGRLAFSACIDWKRATATTAEKLPEG
jgi:arylsulfatase A-like enzyme